MAGDKPSPSAFKAYELPTRASPRLAALRARSAATPYLEAPITPAVRAPDTTRKTARISVKNYSMRLANRGGPSIVSPITNTPIKISSDSETGSKPEDIV
ncbi:hypothetical protein PIB30_043725 [Stylosanthes scabra]|uniref:Uncharacterized protein n=1 Tax=Stylosanthes scabra TaxID=79078 RepID=A0ABU6VEM7_9FABA|nr:hypothetical protein [Stylosanthes scabra]